MISEGKYVYCIICSDNEMSFGPIGIGARGDDVMTIGSNDLSMVISSHPITKFTVARENLLAHQKVIEETMKEFSSVLPVRFGTIAASQDEIKNLLDRRYKEFKDTLKLMENKIELGIKGLWKNSNNIFNEIVEENEGIKLLKQKIQKGSVRDNMNATVEIGKMVESALKIKKEEETNKIVGAVKKTALDYKLNPTMGDNMFINAAFLVDKGREKEFDNIVDDLNEEYSDRTKFKYVGPLPIFNFVNITIYPEEWEK
ncbi:GvpL/GvpF family gas vesicle protein [Candidatus Poribacteria bacterium]|nr:GvpL/GvpF family gas vesicle protein [Candidatus Poribacteria bacterium]